MWMLGKTCAASACCGRKVKGVLGEKKKSPATSRALESAQSKKYPHIQFAADEYSKGTDGAVVYASPPRKENFHSVFFTFVFFAGGGGVFLFPSAPLLARPLSHSLFSTRVEFFLFCSPSDGVVRMVFGWSRSTRPPQRISTLIRKRPCELRRARSCWLPSPRSLPSWRPTRPYSQTRTRTSPGLSLRAASRTLTHSLATCVTRVCV